MSRPTPAPGLVEALKSAVAARIAKKLFAGPGEPVPENPAEAWTWSNADHTVTTDGGETVTISGPEPIEPAGIRCSCLLSPKCFHVLAVATALPGAVAPPVEATPAPPRRPTPAEGLLDAVRAVVPSRVHKRLDGVPNPADGWTWTESSAGWTVANGEGETVTVATTGPVGVADLRCTCLLAPKCFHILAVATALSTAPPAVSSPPPAVVAEVPPEPTTTLDGGQRTVVAATRRAGTAVLLAGATGVGATAREDLVRAVHSCRAVGLHRLARAGQRVLRQVRALQGQRPEFSLADLVEDLRELLLVARGLDADAPPASFIGTARRSYHPVGTLRLFGLCTEPVIATTGHAGVSTLLCDANGRLWTTSDVLPGPPGRARSNYDAAAAIGGSTLSHRALGRNGLFAQNATGSWDGRLGTGGGVKAVRAGPSHWTDAGPAQLFDVPIAHQLDRSELLFLRGVVVGAHDDALVVAVDGLSFPIRLVPPSDHAVLSYRDNLRLLARAPGLPLQIIGRVELGRRGSVSAIAIAPWATDAEGPKLTLPAEWVDRCNLGLDQLVASHVQGLEPRATELLLPEVERPDPLEPFRRRVARLALGGRGTLPGDARTAVEREIAALGRVMMPAAGQVLGGLADAAAAARTEGGVDLAARWLAAAVYEQEATRVLQRASWT